MVFNDEKYPILNSFNSRPLTKFEQKNLFCPQKHINEFSFYEGSIYHLKRLSCDKCLLNELLGEIISEYYNLETVKSRIILSNYKDYQYHS